MKFSMARGAVALFLGMTVSLAANAGTVVFDLGAGDPTFVTSDSNNDILGAGYTLQDNAGVGTSGSLDAGESVRLDFFFLGSEAGWTNTLDVAGAGSYTRTGGLHDFTTAPLPLFSLFQSGFGSLNTTISFTLGNSGSNTVGPANPWTFEGDIIGSLAFAYLDEACFAGMGLSSSCVASTPSSTVLFALDDGGAGPDDNHDDFVGYITATVVPVPGAVWLFGTVLLGLAGFNSRKRRVAAAVR